MLKIAHLNLQRAKPGSPAKHTSLESYYETLIRLHEGLKFPYDECFDDEQNMYAPWRLNYGCHKLEWDHGYYGAARFADGSTGNIEPGWEVSRCLQRWRSAPNLTMLKVDLRRLHQHSRTHVLHLASLTASSRYGSSSTAIPKSTQYRFSRRYRLGTITNEHVS